MKKNLLLLLSSFIIFSSCEKDEIEKKDEVSNATCLPTEINYDNNNYTRKFTYNTESQIIREDIIDNNTNIGYNTFEYNANKLIKQNAYNAQSTLKSYYTYEYNSSNQLIAEKYFDLSNGSAIEKESFTYEYSSPTELKKSSYFENNTLYSYRTYQYSNGLMTKIQSFKANGNQSGQTEIEYDNNKSALSSLNPIIVLFGTTAFPYQKNIIKHIVKDANGQTVNDESYSSTYEYNSQGYPLKRNENRLDGRIRSVLYKYNCKE